PPAPAGRDVPGRRRARGPGLAGAGPLLVHRSSGDLLRGVLVATSLLEALLDVLVLPFGLVAPRLPRHGVLLPSFRLVQSPQASSYPLPRRFTPGVAGAARSRLAGGIRRSD